MTTNLGYHNVVVMLPVALVFASTIINSECSHVLELSSRDEIVEMAGYGEEKLSTVLITGTLFCYEDCLTAPWKHRQLYPRPLSGALVGAICRKSKEEMGSLSRGVCDEYGEFIIDLPSQLHGSPKLEKACLVRILQVPQDSPCYQSSYATKQTKIKLSSVGHQIRTYTTGAIAVISNISKNSEACTKGLEDD